MERYFRHCMAVLMVGYVNFCVNTEALAGYPVTDLTTQQLLQEQTQEQQQQSHVLQQILDAVEDTNTQLGQVKSDALMKLISGYAAAGKQAKLEELTPQNGLSPIASSLQHMVPLHFNDVHQSRETISQLFFGPVSTVTDARHYRKAREQALYSTALQTYAFALYNRKRLAEYRDDTQKLTDVINSSNSVVQEIAANTAVLLAMHEQLAYMQGLLSGLTELESLQILAADPTIKASPLP